MNDLLDLKTTMPVQTHRPDRTPGRAPSVVVMRAYEVYCHVYGPQEALITGRCRGGFASAELIAFLYARSFPQAEWRARTDEAFKGLNV